MWKKRYLNIVPEKFEKISFVISLTNLFLNFIQQVSMVLFPALRQTSLTENSNMYYKLNNYLDAILPIIYIGYIPIKIVLSYWLPQYEISLNYLALLLPICVFDGKMQMISNTYFKVLREEKKLLKVNVLTVIISIILSTIGVYYIKNILLKLIISLLFMISNIMLNNIVSLLLIIVIYIIYLLWTDLKKVLYEIVCTVKEKVVKKYN